MVGVEAFFDFGVLFWRKKVFLKKLNLGALAQLQLPEHFSFFESCVTKKLTKIPKLDT